MIVCVAEKPSVGEYIARVLGANQRKNGYFEGNGYQVTWTFGHLCALYDPQEYNEQWKGWNLSSLPMIPPRFSIKVHGDEGVHKQFNIIKALIEQADEVINCGDAGQEGELIQRWVYQKAGCKCPVKRLWVSSLTEDAIREGFRQLKDQSEYQHLYEAGLMRAIGDWLLGMNATRAYTIRYAKGVGRNRQVLSVGRVQTPTLALVVKRQAEIEHFVPRTYWELKTNYSDVQFKNDGRLKLLIIVGTRPEIIRLAAVINKCRKYFDCILAHTGQNYDYNLNGVFFKDLKLADPEVYMDAVGEDLGATMGNIINASYKLMVQIKPDAVLVLGDTNSCLSVIGAKRLHIPIFHMEAGNRCFDECLPEETNRRIVDIISDVNICYSEHARRYLNASGVAKERTYVSGSPMAEVLHENLAEIEASDVHARLGLEKGKYILLSAHREENIDTEKNFLSLFTAINKMAEKYDMPILYSCHPRSRNRLDASGFKLDPRVIRQEPLGFHDYNCLQMNAFAVVSDSGTLPEESSFFTSVGHSFPAVCIRTSTERPEALDKGCFILAGINEHDLLQAVDVAVDMVKNGDNGIPVPNYVDENVSTKIVKLIQSYTGVVNKMVWRK